jgi:hypothetical protein
MKNLEQIYSAKAGKFLSLSKKIGLLHLPVNPFSIFSATIYASFSSVFPKIMRNSGLDHRFGQMGTLR